MPLPLAHLGQAWRAPHGPPGSRRSTIRCRARRVANGMHADERCMMKRDWRGCAMRFQTWQLPFPTCFSGRLRSRLCRGPRGDSCWRGGSFPRWNGAGRCADGCPSPATLPSSLLSGLPSHLHSSVVEMHRKSFANDQFGRSGNAVGGAVLNLKLERV